MMHLWMCLYMCRPVGCGWVLWKDRASVRVSRQWRWFRPTMLMMMIIMINGIDGLQLCAFLWSWLQLPRDPSSHVAECQVLQILEAKNTLIVNMTARQHIPWPDHILVVTHCPHEPTAHLQCWTKLISFQRYFSSNFPPDHFCPLKAFPGTSLAS